MSQISKFDIDKRVSDEIYNTFLSVVADFNSESQVRKFFTPGTTETVNKRLMSAGLIKPLTHAG